VIGLLAWRNLTHRPWRSALLFLGYGVGVGVMVVLLAIGEALVTQARDEKLVGGGAITVLPDGVDIEVLKTGGVGGMFFSIDHARFVGRQVLGSPRLAGAVTAAAPQVDAKLVYLRLPDDSVVPARATGELPSRTRAVGGLPPLAAGTWDDDAGDRRWADPAPFALHNEIDAFHVPPPDLPDRGSWAEWHYFNVLSADRTHWAFVSFIVAGAPPAGAPPGDGSAAAGTAGATTATAGWHGEVTVALRSARGAGQGGTGHGSTRRFAAAAAPGSVRFSTSDADVTLGASSVRVLPNGDYAVRVRGARGTGGSTLDADLVISPSPREWFPPASLTAESDPNAGGYVVPGLRATATGRICVGGVCDRYDGAQAYHDHNWGTWNGVTWDWGASRAGAWTFLYGRVRSQAADAASLGATAADDHPLVLYLVDSTGFRAAFRPRTITYEDALTIEVDGQRVRVPARATMEDARGADTIRIALTIDDAIGTDMRRAFLERGGPGAARRLTTPYFIQMQGRAVLSGRLDGIPLAGRGAGFFETYRGAITNEGR
jgi:hypothetical protein